MESIGLSTAVVTRHATIAGGKLLLEKCRNKSHMFVPVKEGIYTRADRTWIV
eukprot:SAG31_NODE_83_length_27039_cov_14.035746_24_plen_52_part_00